MFLFQSWESCTMKLWKIISLTLPTFSQCVPKKGVWMLPEAFHIQLQIKVGWVLAPTSGPAQITVFCDWHRTHSPSPGSEKNKTKYFRLCLSDTDKAKRGLTESKRKFKSIYCFSCFKGIFLLHLHWLENRCQDSHYCYCSSSSQNV